MQIKIIYYINKKIIIKENKIIMNKNLTDIYLE